MEREFAASAENEDTILELALFYFRIVFNEIRVLGKEFADNVEAGGTIRGLALLSTHWLLQREY
ncbi:MAG: hypothetical protein O2786_03970 [archaeon]|nr:hypothetical protein [archaeon]